MQLEPSHTRDYARRVDELLVANTALQEQAREHRREADKLQRALSQIVERIGLAEMDKAKPEPKTDQEAALFGEKPSKAMMDVFVERRRQRHHHGYHAAVDDRHRDQELLRSAASRILRRLAEWNQALKPKALNVADNLRPWSETPTLHRQTLVISAALIIAEIDRYDRMLDSFDPAPPSAATPNAVTNTPRPGRCNNILKQMNPPVAIPRTCAECGLGPCKFG